MSKETWQGVRELLGEDSLTLGPYFAQQALHSPRHLLFTLARYKFAARLLPQQTPVDVLELGCGEGFGTLMLAEQGHRVTAVDFDEVAIGHATRTIQKPSVTYRCSDFLGQRFGQFRAVVSLDVIEHIPRPGEETFLQTVCQNLAPDGFCVIGTPNDTASPYASPRSQAGHVNLFTAERLTEVVGRYFQNVFIFGMNDEVLHTGFYPMSHYLFALGCGKR